MPRNYRVWVIGLDGATFDLIQPWVKAGYLPVLERLLREGAWGEVRSTIPPITGPAWTSFMSGTNPGQHGVFDWVYRKSGSYEFHPVTAANSRQPSLWKILSQAGKRVLAINVPMTFPPEEVNGVIVSGLPATTLTTYPAQLARQIRADFPDYVVYPDPGQAYSDQGIQSFLSTLEKSIQGQAGLWRSLTQQEKWDFAMLVYNATDVVQHAMWKFMSPSHPQHDARKAEKYRDAILDTYRKLDAILGETIQAMDEDTVLWLMSDHGFGPITHFIHVNTWLIQQEYMALQEDALTRLKALAFRLGFAPMPVYDLLIRLGFGRFKREVVRGRGQGMLKALFLSFNNVDWEKTKAYSLGNIGQIRINLRGREPHGCVEGGAEYERVVSEIIGGLQELRDPHTGELVIESIYRNPEVYHGKAAGEGADILFLPRRLEYFGFGEYEFADNRVIAPLKRGISGTHRMHGIGIAWGSPIHSARLQQARLEDFAPTILHLMGLPVPAHMDGRPLLEILSGQAGLPEVQVGPGWEDGDNPELHLTSQEEDTIRQRLRDLGYVA